VGVWHSDDDRRAIANGVIGVKVRIVVGAPGVIVVGVAVRIIAPPRVARADKDRRGKRAAPVAVAISIARAVADTRIVGIIGARAQEQRSACARGEECQGGKTLFHGFVLEFGSTDDHPA
jgi:hypothetical protein